MIKVCKLGFFLLLSSVAVAQSDSIWKTPWSFNHLNNDLFLGYSESNLLEIKGSAMLSSSHLNLAFFKDFYKGGTLNPELITSNEKRLKKNQRFGMEQDYSIKWFPSGNYGIDSLPNLQWFVGYKSLTGMKYGKDFYNLMMRGNGYFAGRSADLSKTGFRNLEWINLGLGSLKLGTGKADRSFFSINLVLTGNNMFVNTKGNTSIYTDTFGRFLNVDASGSWKSSKNRPSGIGTTFCYQYAVRINENAAFELGFEDLGLVYSFPTIKGRTFDTSFVFEGFYIYNLNNLSDPNYWNNKTDSLIAPIIDDQKTKQLGMMTAKIFASFTLCQRPRTYWNLGVTYRFGMFALPLIQIKHSFLLTPTLVISSNLGYGGWGALQWDESITMQKGKWGVQLKIAGIHTWFIKQLPGQAGLVGLISKGF